MTTETEDSVPCRPWTLTLEVEHVAGLPFDLDRHGDDVEAEVTERLHDVFDLSGGTRVRVDAYIHRSGDEPLMEAQP